MTGGKTILEELDDIDLTAGGSQGEEVQVMDVYIALPVGLGMLGIEHIHLIELLGTFRTILEHGAHGSITVDVGILTLDIIVLRVLEGEILQGLHQAGIHLPYPGAFCPVEDIFLGSAGMTIFNQGMLHRVLYLFYCGDTALNGILHIGFYLLCQILCHFIVVAAQYLCRLVDSVSDLDPVKSDFASVPLDDLCQHSPLLLILVIFSGFIRYVQYLSNGNRLPHKI